MSFGIKGKHGAEWEAAKIPVADHPPYLLTPKVCRSAVIGSRRTSPRRGEAAGLDPKPIDSVISYRRASVISP